MPGEKFSGNLRRNGVHRAYITVLRHRPLIVDIKRGNHTFEVPVEMRAGEPMCAAGHLCAYRRPAHRVPVIVREPPHQAQA